MIVEHYFGFVFFTILLVFYLGEFLFALAFRFKTESLWVKLTFPILNQLILSLYFLVESGDFLGVALFLVGLLFHFVKAMGFFHLYISSNPNTPLVRQKIRVPLSTLHLRNLFLSTLKHVWQRQKFRVNDILVEGDTTHT